MINICLLSGNIVEPIEVKKVGKKGTSLAKFLLKSGEQNYTIIVWGTKAESLDMLSSKNTILISGQIEKNVWTNRDGQTFEEYQIVADSVNILN